MSVRASASLPSSCSGAMYWTVPRTVPASVSGISVGISVREAVAGDGLQRLGQTEVEDLHARGGQHDVRGLQVPMHDALAVRAIERVGDLGAVSQRLVQRQRSLRQPVRQRLTFQQLHDEVLGSVLMPTS